MTISARILADSSAPCGKRLTTFLCTYPRAIHSEIMTHKMLSKNSASSRAIPTERLMERIDADPWVPSYIGANQKGMQAGEELDERSREQAVKIWNIGWTLARENARGLLKLGVHKQVVNRLLEPWMHIQVVISGTEWTNFFALRCHEAAEPHFQELARGMRDAMAVSTPRRLEVGQWHLPMVNVDAEDSAAIEEYARSVAMQPAEHDKVTEDIRHRLWDQMLCKIAVGRLARVSYLTHDGRRDPAEDVALHDRMCVQVPLHASPAEHVAQALDWPAWYRERSRYGEQDGGVDAVLDRVTRWRRENDAGVVQPPDWLRQAEVGLAHLRSGNLLGFKSYRKFFVNEHVGGLVS